MGSVPDFLRPGLNIIFVGFNPGILSGKTGHHFANPTKRFWKLLHEAGLTPRKYTPEEAGLLLDLGLGLTNIVPRTTQAASDIRPEEFVRGRQLLLQKLRRYHPRVVCWVGKGVYQAQLAGCRPNCIVPSKVPSESQTATPSPPVLFLKN